MARGNNFNFDDPKLLGVDRIRLVEVRLECLKLGLTRHGASDLRPPLDIADAFYAWVIGSRTDPQEPGIQEPEIAATPSPKGRVTKRKDAADNPR